jgi:hypothetical protein
MGQIGILNVGAGDTKLVFDKNNPEDCARAARTVADMIRRGYVILVEVAKDDKGEALYRRVKEFKEDSCEYIIAGDVNIEAMETTDGQSGDAAASGAGGKKSRKGVKHGPYSTRRIHASAASGIAVGRTAGG